MPPIKRAPTTPAQPAQLVNEDQHKALCDHYDALAADSDQRRREEESRKEKLAINIFDIDRLDPTIRHNLLKGKLATDRTAVLRLDKEHLHETALPFTCGLLTAGAICDIIRGIDRRMGDSPTRVYVFKGLNWTKVPFNKLLTVVKDSQAVLNPAIFPPTKSDVVSPDVRTVQEAVALPSRRTSGTNGLRVVAPKNGAGGATGNGA